MKTTLLILSMSIIASSHSHGNSWIFEADINRGINNNVFLESDEILNSSKSDNDVDRDIQSQVSLFGGYQLSEPQNYSAALFLDYFKESFKDNDLDTQATALLVPAHYYFNNLKLKGSISLTRYTVTGVDILRYQSSELSITRKQTALAYGIALGRTRKIADDKSYEEYEGISSDITAYNKLYFRNNTINLKLGLFNNDYQEPSTSNQGYQFTAGFNQRNPQHSWLINTQFKHRQYDENLINERNREEWQWSLDYTHDYHLNKHSDVYINLSHLRNRSNIKTEEDDYNYRQLISSIGFRFFY